MRTSDHTVGAHSDDRGGTSDFPCYCGTLHRIPDTSEMTPTKENQLGDEELHKNSVPQNQIHNLGGDIGDEAELQDILNRTDFKGSVLMVATYHPDSEEFGWTPLVDVLSSWHNARIREARKLYADAMLDRLAGFIDYNKHDMGEMGKFIRTEYAYNAIESERQRNGGKQNG